MVAFETVEELATLANQVVSDNELGGVVTVLHADSTTAGRRCKLDPSSKAPGFNSST